MYPHERDLLACGLSFGHCDRDHHRASTNKRLANLEQAFAQELQAHAQNESLMVKVPLAEGGYSYSEGKHIKMIWER